MTAADRSNSAIITGGEVHDQTTQRLRVTLEKGLAGWVVRNRQAALIPDTSQDERWMLQQYDVDEKTSPKSAVCAPLLVHERLIGVMTLVHPQGGLLYPDHLALVQAIADQAGIAVLNARLYQESQRQARVMTALAESAADDHRQLEPGRCAQPHPGADQPGAVRRGVSLWP